jgi:glycosyltransferase involved in cell wall biosynthesis
LLEAASSAKPIIATDVPGCREVVEDQVNGLLCKLKDSKDLANKMRTVSHYTDDQLKMLGINGRLKVESQFDESLVINKYLHTLDELKSKSVSHAGY